MVCSSAAWRPPSAQPPSAPVRTGRATPASGLEIREAKGMGVYVKDRPYVAWFWLSLQPQTAIDHGSWAKMGCK